MARPNDTPGPSGVPHKGKEPARTERTERTEGQRDSDVYEPVNEPTQKEPNRRSSILIDGDEEDPNRHEVTFEDFLSYIHEKPEWLYGKLRMIHEQFEDVTEDREARLAESELYGQAKDGEIVLMKKRLDELNERLNQMTADRDAYANKIAYNTLHPTNQTSAGDERPSYRKSAKIPDPPLLTDGKEPRFEDWLLLMTQKLEANHDHYDSPQLRRAYVASRCDGKARKHITPRLRSESANPYEDCSDMIEHLKTIYEDPNRVTTAKNQFRQLYMKTTDRFHDFLSEFLYLAAEAGVSDNDLKDELYHRITTKLQELTMAEINSNGTFRQFTSFCSQTASRLEVMSHRIQKNRQYTSSQGRIGTTSSSTAGAPVKKEPGTPSPTNSTVRTNDRSQLMREGKCFNCHKRGHLSMDCPKKQNSDLKELERPTEPNPNQTTVNDSENV